MLERVPLSSWLDSGCVTPSLSEFSLPTVLMACLRPLGAITTSPFFALTGA